MNARIFSRFVAVLAGFGSACGAYADHIARADGLPTVAVEGQPLAANIIRLSQALEVLGWPFDANTTESLRSATAECDAERIQRIVDSHVVCLVTINPESRVKVERGPGAAVVQQAGFTPLVVKVVNQFHTNPVNVSVAGAPIRASRASARWCEAAIHQLWRVRAQNIADAERPDAERTFQQAIEIYRRIASETEGD